MNTLTLSTYTEFSVETCCTCGTMFAMTKDYRSNRLNNGGSFYCPNGHSMSYTKPRVKELEEELEAKRKELTAAKCDLLKEKNLRDQLQKNHDRLVKKGVCPCCRRSFLNLKRHIKTKHPEYIQ